MPFIGQQPQSGAYSALDSITTSATDTYNLTLDGSAYYPQSANQLLVSLNGVLQAPNTSYNVSGSQIIFSSALTSSDVIDFITALGNTYDIGTPTDGTVSTAKIATGAVTTAKLSTGHPNWDSSGNVGIGTSSPRDVSGYASLAIDDTSGSLLDMNVNGTRTTSLTVINSETQFGTITNTPLALWTNNAERMRIDSSGNVGINNTTPSISPYVSLNVKGGGSSGIITAQSSDSGSSVAIYSGNNSSDHPAILYQRDLRIGSTTGLGTTGYTERMRIDSSGRVTMPSQPAIILDGSGGGIKPTGGTDLTFFTQLDARGGMSLNASLGRVTVPVDGWYAVHLTIYGYFDNIGEWRIRLRKNGSNQALTHQEYPGSSFSSYSGPWDISQHLNYIVRCSANDYIHFYVESMNGGTSHLIYGGGQHSYCVMYLLG